MSKINFNEANEMYAGGMSYEAIAKYYGVTRQYVHAFMNSDNLKHYRKRKNSAMYKKIVYKGFTQLFDRDDKLTIPSLTRMVAGYSNRTIQGKLTRMMTGQNVSIPKAVMDRLLELSGLSYEQFFEKV